MSRHSSRGAEWDALRAQVLTRDPVCTYCKANQSTQADHVTPKVDGGQDTLSNLVGSCGPCNRKKGSRTMTRRTWVNPRWTE